MLSKRLLTSVVAVPLLFGIIWYLPPAYFVAVIAAAAALGQYELYRIARSRGVRPNSMLGIVIGVAFVIVLSVPGGAQGFLGYATVALLVVMLARLFSPRPTEGSLDDMAVTLFGVFYVAMLFGFQGAIGTAVHGKQWIVFLYLVIWASDTAAYFAGTAWGKHRLYEKISPRKSVEGLGAGIAGAVAVALLCRVWFMPPITVREAVLLGLLIAVAGTLGDLSESLIKRGAGVKDSGTLIPGHGGILDRMDSVLFAAPVLWYYLSLR